MNVLKETCTNLQYSGIDDNTLCDEIKENSKAKQLLAYIWNDTYLTTCDTLPKVPMRVR